MNAWPLQFAAILAHANRAQSAVQLQRGALAASGPTRVNEMRDKKQSGKN
jgi:hypothetical protein